jgi:signal-transduction protein with cAMP-binding, CBS, and nucleotidyltransferase domain
MTIGNICNKRVITINKNLTIQKAANIMADQNIGCLIVTNESDDAMPIGTITDRDIVVKAIAKDLNLKETNVSEIMAESVSTIDENKGVFEVIRMMSERKIRRLPIVRDNQIIGIVAFDDLIIMLAQEINTLAEIPRQQIA